MTKFGYAGQSWESLDIAGHDDMVVGKPTTVLLPGRGGEDWSPWSPPLFGTTGEILELIREGLIAVPVFTDRVRHGMDVLDEVAPRWWREIDTDTLDLSHTNRCVLGQTWPHYARLRGLAGPSAGFHVEARHDDHIVVRYSYDLTETILSDGYHRMVRYAAGGDDEVTAHEWASSIGCTLADEDYLLANVQAKKLVSEAVPAWVLHTDTGKFAMTKLARLIIQTFFEQLTATWLTEIHRAHATHRWAPPILVDAHDRTLLTV